MITYRRKLLLFFKSSYLDNSKTRMFGLLLLMVLYDVFTIDLIFCLVEEKLEKFVNLFNKNFAKSMEI